MSNEIVTVAEMYAADSYAVSHGVPSLELMETAGRSVTDVILERWSPRPTVVLCGPGNNGGDGYVVARLLKAGGWHVRVAHLGALEGLKGDAAEMAKRWDGALAPMDVDSAEGAGLVVDAMFGAGLSRAIEGVCDGVTSSLNRSAVPVVAIDVPSGLHGDLGRPLGELCVDADLTVTFFRKKPAHVLMPGRAACGKVIVADIGIPESALGSAKLFENGPALWEFPWPQPLAHKYARGHCVVVSGPAHATGAARLAARAALRIGAGLVSVASPPEAVLVNAGQLTAVMVKPFSGAGGLADLLKDKRIDAVVIGPGCGTGRATQEMVAAVLASGASVVLDADALTAFASDPKALMLLLHDRVVLTPHAGEFERVFPGLLAHSFKQDRSCWRSRCGGEVHGSGQGTRHGNRNAGRSGHRQYPCAADIGDRRLRRRARRPHRWSDGAGTRTRQSSRSRHMAARGGGVRFGPGLIAEDLPDGLPAVLAGLKDGAVGVGGHSHKAG